MIKWIQLVVIILAVSGCKSVATTPNQEVKAEPTFAYKQQIENLEKGIYFRGVGNEPEWSLKISENDIEFTSLKPGFESFNGPHVEPIRAMDANVKLYSISTENGLINIQIQQLECINTMSGDKMPYTVRIEMTKGKSGDSVIFNGCGKYIINSNLHDIWVLEKLNGENVNLTNFMREFPNLEINSSTGQFMGFSGCNRMNGTIFFEKGLLRFTNTATTRMVCGENNKENEFLKALASTTTYKVENMRLILTNPAGVEVVFKKVD
jgi:heat shock protein HslJ/uncharacterized membrane protein